MPLGGLPGPERPVPEQELPERILRGQLAGAGVDAAVARTGDRLVLSGPGLVGGPLECTLDRRGPEGTVLDEPLAQAACGLMGVHGRARGERGRRHPAARLGVDYVLTAAGVVLAQGVLAALLGRMRGRAASGVTVSVAGTALLTVSQYLAAGTADEPDLAGAAAPGHPPPFRSADGVWFELETLDAEPWRLLWTGLGVPEAVAGRAWRPFMLRYAAAVAPLPAELHAAAGSRPFAELRHAATAAGVAVQPLRSHAQRCRDLGGQDPFAAPWTVDPAVRVASPPVRQVPGGSPLEGLLVVEAGRRVQGPLAGHVLGLLGAEVVRIEPSGGDPLRGMPPMAGECSARFLALNRGKQVVEADLRSAVGRRTVLDTVRDADVFLHNWAPGKAAELGLDHGDVAAVNPRLVSAYASGWGDALGADPPPGTDFMVQAYAGLGEHLTVGGEPPAGSLLTLLDVLGGLTAAAGVLAGLLGREQDGRGRRVASSLLSTATLLQAPFLQSPRPPAPFPPVPFPQRGLGRSADAGAEAIRGVPLGAADGELVLSRTASPRVVAGLLGVGDAARVPAAVASLPVREALGALTGGGVDAVQVRHDLSELATDPWTTPLLCRERCAFVRPPWTFAA